MSHRFEFDLYEHPDAHSELDTHRSYCEVCKKATSIRSACNEARILHDTIVLQSRANVQSITPRQTLTIDLKNVDKTHFQEVLKHGRTADLAQLQGIDVSVWQGNFPWAEALNRGVALGIPKATEGFGYTDPQWTNNLSWLTGQTKIVGGSYHFGRPDLGNSPIDEANWYLSRHPSICFHPDFPWVFSLDAESNGGSASWCYAFMDHVSQQIGYDCWFYSYQNWIQSRGVQAFNRPLWIAWPNAGSPPNLGWPVVTMHQYGTSPYSVGDVDADLFLGDIKTLLVLGGVGSPSPPKTRKEIPEMLMITPVGGDGNPSPGFLVIGDVAVEIPDQANTAALEGAGIQVVKLSADFASAIQAALKPGPVVTGTLNFSGSGQIGT